MFFFFCFWRHEETGAMLCYRVYFIQECRRAPAGLLIGRGWHQNT